MISHPKRSTISKPKRPVKTITRAVAKRVLAVVDAGLVAGNGDPEPGKMCVEAAVCFAMGLPHGDRPECVAPAPTPPAPTPTPTPMPAPGCQWLDLAEAP